MDSNGSKGPPFAVVHDIAATWDDYASIRRAVTDASIHGLIMHAAGPTDDGFRTIDVWTSQDAWHRHRADLDRVLHGLCVPTAMREFRVDHLITSPPTLRSDSNEQ